MRTILSFKNKELVIELPINEESMSFKSLKAHISTLKNEVNMNRDNNLDSEKAKTLEKAETKLTLQKFYKSYWTRRNQAACAVVIEALSWKEMECAALRQSSVSFFTADHKSETVVSKWQRALIRAAKVGKGLSKDEKAQKLVLIHWLEAIDPLHRYGGNLHPYYDVWLESESNQPFFYWLDIGDGKDLSLEKCSRADLQLQCIKYLGPKEREAYEVIMENGKLVYKQSRVFVDTPKGTVWIFVLGTSGDFYVGKKKKGFFQHSSFLAGGTTKASGRLVAHNGILEAIWPYSGHYRPTEEHFKEFCSFLEDHQIDLTNIKKFAIDEDTPPKVIQKVEPIKSEESAVVTRESIDEAKKHASEKEEESIKMKVEFMKKPPLLQTWSKVAGPTKLQFHTVEQVLNLSPRSSVKPAGSFLISSGLVASPRPSSKIQFSPSTLACLGLGLPNPIHLSNLNNN